VVRITLLPPALTEPTLLRFKTSRPRAVYLRVDDRMADAIQDMTRRLGISAADVARIALAEKFEREFPQGRAR
jgi:hypothetical protein